MTASIAGLIRWPELSVVAPAAGHLGAALDRPIRFRVSECLCYAPRSTLDPWCSGQTCQPVTLEIAGSNPVGSAIAHSKPRPPPGSGLLSCPPTSGPRRGRSPGLSSERATSRRMNVSLPPSSRQPSTPIALKAGRRRDLGHVVLEGAPAGLEERRTRRSTWSPLRRARSSAANRSSNSASSSGVASGPAGPTGCVMPLGRHQVRHLAAHRGR